MGSIITLGLDRLNLDWGKNGIGIDHSKLFLPGDIRDVTYYYADNEREVKLGYARALRSVVKRLELLGYTISKCKQIYQDLLKETPDWCSRPSISFDAFSRILKRVDVRRIRMPDEIDNYDFGELAAKILTDPEFVKRSAKLKNFKKWDGEFFANLDPCLIIRMLAENPKNWFLDVSSG